MLRRGDVLSRKRGVSTVCCCLALHRALPRSRLGLPACSLDPIPSTLAADAFAVCLGRLLELLLLLDRQPRSQLAPQMQQQHVAMCAAALDVVLPQLTAVAAGLSLSADRRRPWCTWPHAAQCAAAATCGFMQPAVEELVRAASRDRASPEGARLARLLQATAALVLHMPAGAASQQAGGGTCQCQLLALLATALQAQLDLARSSGVVAAQVQPAQHLLPLLPRLVGLTAVECRSIVPLQQVVSAASLLLSYLCDLATASNMQAPGAVRSLADIPDWCVAASAALRMLHAAAEAAQQAEEQTAAAGAAQQGDEQAAAAGAAQQAEEQAAAAGVGAVPGQPSPGLLASAAGVLALAVGQQCGMAAGQAAVTVTVDDAAASAATTALLQPHSTVCRAAAWTAASGAQRWLPCLPTTVRFDALAALPVAALCWLLTGGPSRSQHGPLTELASRLVCSCGWPLHTLSKCTPQTMGLAAGAAGQDMCRLDPAADAGSCVSTVSPPCSCVFLPQASRLFGGGTRCRAELAGGQQRPRRRVLAVLRNGPRDCRRPRRTAAVRPGSTGGTSRRAAATPHLPERPAAGKPCSATTHGLPASGKSVHACVQVVCAHVCGKPRLPPSAPVWPQQPAACLPFYVTPIANVQCLLAHAGSHGIGSISFLRVSLHCRCFTLCLPLVPHPPTGRHRSLGAPADLCADS